MLNALIDAIQRLLDINIQATLKMSEFVTNSTNLFNRSPHNSDTSLTCLLKLDVFIVKNCLQLIAARMYFLLHRLVSILFILSVKGLRYNSKSAMAKQSITRTAKLTSKLAMSIQRPTRYTSNDWFENLLALPSSRIFHRTKYCILQNIIWTTLLVFLFKKFKPTFSFPSIVHSISGSALSLLLVFRTNSSYDRFWEARKAWGILLITCRDIARNGRRKLPSSCYDRLAKLLMAFSITLKQHLQGSHV